MTDSAFTYFEPACLASEISAYIDGELEPAREIEFEKHVSECGSCLEELNYQKQFLSGLNLTLKNEDELELPANFARVVVARAEGNVSGLRRPRERFNAVLICSVLALIVLFSLRPDAGNLVAGATELLEKGTAVAGFFLRLSYSFFTGVAAVIRALSGQFLSPAAFGLLFFAAIAALFAFFSRLVLRAGRA